MKLKLSALVFTIATLFTFSAPAQAADLDVNLNANTGMFSMLNFTLVPIGNEKTGTISITNTSSAEIKLTPVLGGGTEDITPGEFSLQVPDDTTLSPNESLTLEVTLAPTSLGDKSAWVKLSEEAPYEKFLEFSGSSIEDTGEGYYLYKAEAGDTITYIAERFKMKKSDIMESNGINSYSELRVGDILKIYKSQIGDIPLGTPIGTTPDTTPDPTPQPEIKFTDITNHWASPFIKKLFQLGIVNGRTETTFAPNDTVNRAELTKMVVNAAGLEINESETTSSFSDVPAGHWAIPYIEAAHREGIIEGYVTDGQKYYKPSAEVNRAEAIKMILFAAGYNDVSAATPKHNFSDVANDAWYAKYIYFADQNDFASGYVDGTFRPGDSLTRGGAAKFVALTFGLYDPFETFETTTNTDNTPAALIPKISKEKQAEYPAVCADLGNSKLHNEFGQLPVEAGIIECQYSTADYKLDQPINRAEAAKILYTLKLFSVRPDLTTKEREEIKNTGNTPTNISANYKGFIYQPGRFSDVQSSDWFANYVETLNKWHIISGDEFNSTYRPEDSLNNAESIKLIISSFLSGGQYDNSGPVQYGTDLISEQESSDYFQKKYATNINNLKQGFSNIDDQAWYITYLAEADANGLSGSQTKYTSNDSTPVIFDSTTREDFILWAMRIYTSKFNKQEDKRQRLLPNDLSKNFTMGRDNLSIKNGTFIITLGDIIHAFDFRYTIPANDTNFNDKRYFFEGDEMKLSYYQTSSGELDHQKLEKTFEKYSIRNQKGEKLNAKVILENWEKEVSGGNCSGFPAIAASVFNNYTQLEHYTGINYNKLFQIQENDSELRFLNTKNPSQSTYIINMADQIRIAWLKSEFAAAPKNDSDHVSPKQLVQAYQEFFDQNPGIDYSKGFHTIPYTNGYRLASGGAHAILFYSYKQEGNKHFFGTYDSNLPNADNLYFVVTDDGSLRWTVEYLAEDQSGNFYNPYKDNSNPDEWKINSAYSLPISINKIDYLGNTRHTVKSDWLSGK